MYKLRILDQAVSDLENLDRVVARRVVTKINWLAENIELINPLQLKGNLSDLYKLRVGDYRIIYEINKEEEIIIIHFIGHRREIYKK